jgi:hypothetical protein
VDIIVTEENSGKAADALACWWEQPAGGATNANWTRHTIATQYTMNSLEVADVDRDGDMDLVITDFQVKRTNVQLAVGRDSQLDGIWMTANEGRGKITAARVVHDGPNRKTLRTSDVPTLRLHSPPVRGSTDGERAG